MAAGYLRCMASVWVSTPFNIDLEFEVAPFYRRLAAWALDLLLLLLYANGMKLFLLENIVFSGADYPIGIDLLLVSLPMLLYPLLMEVMLQGQSLGKRLLSVRVISLEGGEPKIGQYMLRWLFRFWEWPLVFGFVSGALWGLVGQVLATVLLGIFVGIIISISPRHQRFGDIAAGTTVVSVSHQFSLADTVFQSIERPDYTVRFPQVMRLSDRDINAIKGTLTQLRRTGRYETAHSVSAKIKTALQIESDKNVDDFLETLLEDYNFLATQEG
jgi:uncharacterized RDD family membrane protein YckC